MTPMSLKRVWVLTGASVLLLTCALVPSAYASPITLNLTAKVVGLFNPVTPPGTLDPAINDLVFASFTYDTAATPFNDGSPTYAAYNQSGYSILVDGTTFTPQNDYQIQVVNDSQDSIQFEHNANFPGGVVLANGSPGNFTLYFNLIDTSQTALSDVSLPFPLPPFSSWTSSGGGILNNDTGQQIYLEIVDAQVNTVPEPATLGLLGIGLAAIVMRHRRRR